MTDLVRHRPRRRFSVVGVLGELLITVGVLVLLYLVWQLWIGDLIYGAQANSEGRRLSQDWGQDAVPIGPAPTTPDEPASPPSLPEPADGVDFGVMHIPRFGPDYAVPMAGGVTRAGTLDRMRIGHYPGTSMPGQLGNFAVAAHRTTWGAAFGRIAELRIGDAIVAETAEGWFTYRFRTLEYVTPSEVEVLLPVPQAPELAANAAYITMTSCSPKFSLAERIVAYGVFESFTSRSDGPPASLQPVAGA